MRIQLIILIVAGIVLIGYISRRLKFKGIDKKNDPWSDARRRNNEQSKRSNEIYQDSKKRQEATRKAAEKITRDQIKRGRGW